MERFVLSMLYKTAIKSNQSSDATGTLAYAPHFRYLAYVCWLLPVGLLILSGAMHFGIVEASQKDLKVAIFAFALLFTLALSIHLEFSKVSIEYDDDEIHTSSPWRRSRRTPWSDVSSVKFAPSYQWYEVKTQNNGTIRCHMYLSGLRVFLEELEERGHSTSGPHPYSKA